jgi:proline iminopeptidase
LRTVELISKDRGMRALYPEIEPYAHGMLKTAGGNLLYWELCGNPLGKTAVVLHGGPGSGCSPWFRRLFDPAAYRVVLFDQRGCGRSRPNASLRETSLAENTTEQLIADVERVREHVGVERWLVLGGSWGSALALAYAEQHPGRVTEMVLFGVTTGRREEFDWLFRDGLAAFFPDAWERRRKALPAAYRDGDVVDAYCRLLDDPDDAVRERAALAWCLWESATPDWPPTFELAARFSDRSFAIAFARLVTHYVRNNAWLGDGRVMRHVDKLAAIPCVLVNGRFDFQAPVATAWQLSRLWPLSTLVVVNDAGHAANHPGITHEIVRATDRFSKG